MTDPCAVQTGRDAASRRRICAIALAVIMLAAGWSWGVVAHADDFSGRQGAVAASGVAAAASNATPAVTATAPGTAVATITPVTPVSAPTPVIVDDGPNNTAKYLVTGVVLAVIAVVVAVLVALWFIVD